MAASMILDALRKLMPPPESPVGCGTWAQWAEVQSELGLRLPIDYKYYINTYGSGWINDFLYVLNPFAGSKHLELIRNILQILNSLRANKERSGTEEVPYPLYAEPGGLLPWGFTDDGHTLYWITIGNNPDKWKVVIGESRGSEWEEYNDYMVDLLVKLLSGERTSWLLGNNLRINPKIGHASFLVPQPTLKAPLG